MGGVLAVVDFSGNRVDVADLEAMANAASYRGELQIHCVDPCVILAVQVSDARSDHLVTMEDGRVIAFSGRLDACTQGVGGATGTSYSPHGRVLGDVIAPASSRDLDDLYGDFSCVWWDPERRALGAAVDAMGVRTVNHARMGNLCVFASEARQVAMHPRVGQSLSLQGVGMWLLNQYDEETTLFKHVSGLRPGHAMTCDAHGNRKRVYWDLAQVKPLRLKGVEEAAEALIFILRDCVRDRIDQARGPLGCELSGGMDSTTVAALTAEQINRPLTTVSYRFATLSSCDESTFASDVIRHLRLDGRFVDAESRWFMKNMWDRCELREDPLAGWDDLETEVISILARQGERATLFTGHGGDLFFAAPHVFHIHGLGALRGDAMHRREFARACCRVGIPWWKGMVRGVLAPWVPPWIKRIRHHGKSLRLPDWLNAALFETHELPHRFLQAAPLRCWHPARVAAYAHMHLHSYGVRRAIHWYERLAGPLGVRVEHPLYDRRVASFCFSIPQHILRWRGWSKGLLRHTLSGRLPESVCWREDKPLLVDYYRLGLQRECDALVKLIRSSHLQELGWIHGDVLEQRLRKSIADPPGEAPLFLPALLVEAWLQARDRALAHPPHFSASHHNAPRETPS